MLGRRWIGWILPGLVSFALAGGWFAPKAAFAGDSLDVEKWLARPGVRLLVVEFYATWCQPCMEAVPRWTALHERHADDGLRLVVVNTLDPQGGCTSPGWNPDDMVCDLEGFQQERFKVNGQLPSAMLWSWQGQLLVKHGHVDEVERAVKAYLAESPRVHVEATTAKGRPNARLQAMVVNELNAWRKLEVVADPKELKRLRALRRASHSPAKRSEQQCELGAEVSANSLLTATVLGKTKGARKLSLALFSVESGCQIASHYVGYSEKTPELSVREAVAGLHDAMRHAVVMPTTAPKSQIKAQTKRPMGETEAELESMRRGFSEKNQTPRVQQKAAHSEGDSELLTWVAAGAGAALIGGGAYLLLSAQESRDEVAAQEGDDLTLNQASNQWEDANRSTRYGYALTGAGLVSGITAWWLWNRASRDKGVPITQADLWLLPGGLSGFSLGGRF